MKRKRLADGEILPFIHGDTPMCETEFWAWLKEHQGESSFIPALLAFCPEFNKEEWWISEEQIQNYRYTHQHFFWRKFHGYGV